MNVGKKVATSALAAIMMTTGLTLASAGTAEAAGAKYKCKVVIGHLDWGRPTGRSQCKKSKSGKKVHKHRVVLTCDVIRGVGAGQEHAVPWDFYGPWVSPGKKSHVKCSTRSFLRSMRVVTK
ncbi:hypothetical protein [Streptomyces violens]|uniref:hypothetical protein n=1 Tax=Streptomyces violens TaxID=66377 RepID=UPI0004C06A48|nr:hypothetical protein [Streptomyces violens]